MPVRGSAGPGARRLAMGTASLVLATLLAAVAALLGLIPGVPGPGADAATSAVHTVRLHLSVTTSSDHTSVTLTPGTVAASRVAAGAADRTSGGWVLHGGQAEIDAVYHEASSTAPVVVHVTKGYRGTTRVRITNTTATPFPVATVTDDVHDPSDGTNPTSHSVDRAAAMGRHELALPTADPRKLVLAFYYGWWRTYDDSHFADRPVQPRSAFDAAAVMSMTRQARSAGISGFVVSWAGAEHDGVPFDRALAAAAASGGVVAPYLETAAAAKAARASGTSTVDVAGEWLRQALDRADSSAFLHAGDAAVVFVYDSGALRPAQWQALLASAGRPVRLVMDTDDPAYAGVAWGVHRYAATQPAGELSQWSRAEALALRAPAAVSAGEPRLLAATVSPGYDDHRLRGDTNPVVPRGPTGQRYVHSWDAALSGAPDWVLVTSWNEWFEGTNVEPGVRSGSLALRQTGVQAARWRAR